MEAGNILVALHIDVDQVALSEVVNSVFEQIVLNEAPFHDHAVFGFHVVVGEVGKAAFFLAELDCLSYA